MHTFRYLWESATASTTGTLSEETLASILLEKLEQSNKLKDDIAYYYRLPENHVDHSYAYLKRRMGRFLERQQQKRNRDEMVVALQKGM